MLSVMSLTVSSKIIYGQVMPDYIIGNKICKQMPEFEFHFDQKDNKGVTTLEIEALIVSF